LTASIQNSRKKSVLGKATLLKDVKLLFLFKESNKIHVTLTPLLRNLKIHFSATHWALEQKTKLAGLTNGQ
jgi:hypothetical protein